MRAVLQRVTEASVTIDGQKVGEIGMLDKVINLRIFDDENGKMNLSLLDID